MYRGVPRLGAYEKAVNRLKMPLCYNGNLFSAADYKRITERFPDTCCFMYGRGLITNPGLVTEIREGIRPDKKTVREFHDCLFEEYSGTSFRRTECAVPYERIMELYGR